MMLPEDLNVALQHCGTELRSAGGGVGWQGIVERSYERRVCDNCGLKVTVTAEDLSPLPNPAQPV